MVDDTYYITPHEAALAVVATAMKKSRLPFHILFINSIMGAFLFSAGGMLYVMCESQGRYLLDNGMGMFVNLSQGAVYALGLFYVIICGMELFNSNILFFSVGVMRGAVTLMDLFISWFVSFWVNLASTIFVVYVFCWCSGILKQPNYVVGTLSIAANKVSFSFMETFLKSIAGNFFVCLAVYLQIMVKPIHVKLIMIFLPIFTFVAMGFTHVVADMFLVPAGIFNNCGYGFGTYFWKIMLPGALGNMIGGSFFGIVIPWLLHLVVIEHDMKKLNLPAYEEKDEQPMLNMDSRVVRVPTNVTGGSTSTYEYKPDDENDISRVTSRRTLGSTSGYDGRSLYPVTTAGSIRSRTIRSPKGVFPVVDMGPPLRKEQTIASAYQPELESESENNLDDVLDDNNDDNSNDDDINDDAKPNPYNPEEDKVGDKLMRAITRTVTRKPEVNNDLEKAQGTGNHNAGKDETSNEKVNENESGNENENMGDRLMKAITRTLSRRSKEKDSADDHYDTNTHYNNDEEIPPEVADESVSSAKPIKVPRFKSKVRRSTYIPQPRPLQPVRSRSTPSNPFDKLRQPSNKLFRQFTFGGGGNNSNEITRRLSQAKITKKAAEMSNDIAGIHESTLDKGAHSYSQNEVKRRGSVAASRRSSKAIEKPRNSVANAKLNHMMYDYDLDGERPVSFISDEGNNDVSSNTDSTSGASSNIDSISSDENVDKIPKGDGN